MKRKQLSLGFESELVSKPNRVKPLRRIEFDHNPNNKLLCKFFIHLFPGKFRTEKDEVLEIRLKGMHFGYAKVIEFRSITLTNAVINNLISLSEGLHPKDHFEAKYGELNNVNMDEPIVEVLLEKVMQLDLFSQISQDEVSQTSES